MLRIYRNFTHISSLKYYISRNPNYAGIPVKWEPSTVDDPCYLVIDDSLELKKTLLNDKRMQFWHDIKKHFITE